MDIYWLWLTALEGVGPVTQRNLVKEFGSPRAVYTATQGELKDARGLRSQVVETILDSGRVTVPACAHRHGHAKSAVTMRFYSEKARSTKFSSGTVDLGTA